MKKSVMLHLKNSEPLIGEIEELPDPTHQFMIIHNPRKIDGTELPYLSENVAMTLFPWHRIELVQLLPPTDIESVIGFVRE